MTDIAHRLSVSTSTVIRKLKEFKFETNWQKLPEIMSWDEYSFKKGKMSFTSFCSFTFRKSKLIISSIWLRRLFLMFTQFFKPSFGLSWRTETRFSMPWNCPTPTPSWKQLTISSRSLSETLLDSGTLTTSRNAFSSLWTSKERERISSSLKLSWHQPTTVDKELLFSIILQKHFEYPHPLFQS